MKKQLLGPKGRRDRITERDAKKLITFLVGTTVITFVCLFVAGCPSLMGKADQPIDAGNIAPLWNIVLERYDTYVAADENLTDLERTAYELDSTLLNKILEKALGE